MASNSCTFIVVPDATSECKRYTIPKSLLWTVGVMGAMIAIIIGGALYLVFGEYKAMSMKAGQFERLKRVSSSQRTTIEQYEQDITQLSKHLAQIKQLNSRLLIMTGLDPAKNSESDELGIGGAEEGDTTVEP
ncbi:hypothetical protein CSA56_09210 [candidate division KSB3 bacterium]|uniref:Uncharacterized protein n=1 Tax=candidate division KSB3 bacterium TaxID=2044937 RepID=A0A2G6KEH1_9BACT|nr:MAG: hypothetical protein CSA56_09210 [candidate division KSB3 bacterium]